MDLHPYDGGTRCFSHTDANRANGLQTVARVLSIQQSSLPKQTLYDLSFYSGGMGIMDRLAITLPVNEELIAEIMQGLDAWSPESLVADPEFAEGFLWFINAEEDPDSSRERAVDFINKHRQSFQTDCAPEHEIWFDAWSDCNDWKALWRTGNHLHYLASSSG